MIYMVMAVILQQLLRYLRVDDMRFDMCVDKCVHRCSTCVSECMRAGVRGIQVGTCVYMHMHEGMYGRTSSRLLKCDAGTIEVIIGSIGFVCVTFKELLLRNEPRTDAHMHSHTHVRSHPRAHARMDGRTDTRTHAR